MTKEKRLAELSWRVCVGATCLAGCKGCPYHEEQDKCKDNIARDVKELNLLLQDLTENLWTGWGKREYEHG